MLESSQYTSDLRVEVLGSVDALRAISSDWDDLWRRSQVTMPTLWAEPVALWIESFAPASRLRIITVRQGERLLGALPLVERRIAGVMRVADLPLNPWSPNGELLVDQAVDFASIVARLAEAACDVPWPLLWFEMAPYRTDRWEQFAKALSGQGARVDTRHGFEIGRVSLKQPFDEYFGGRSKNLRRSVSKDLKRLAGEGPVELQLLDDLKPEEVEAALRRAFEIEDKGWKGAGGTSVLGNEGVFEFYVRQAKHFAEHGILRVAFLQTGNRAIAFELGWVSKAVYHSFKVGYDEEYRRFGPGHLLRYHLIEAGCGDPKLDYVDYQGPLNEALHSWATEKYSIGRLAVCLPRISSRALWMGLRAARGLSRTLSQASAWMG